MNTQVVNLNDNGGGVATVVLAGDLDLPRAYRNHARLHTLFEKMLPQTFNDVNATVPSTTRLILIGGTLKPHDYAVVKQVAERRNLPFLTKRNAAALDAALHELLPEKTSGVDTASNGAGPPETDVAGGVAHGKLSAFILANANWAESNAENARRLLSLAHSQGLTTTHGSLAQGMSVARRKHQAGGVPRSIQSKAAVALQTLDDAIAGLQMMRDWVQATEAENQTLKAKYDRLKAALD